MSKSRRLSKRINRKDLYSDIRDRELPPLNPNVTSADIALIRADLLNYIKVIQFLSSTSKIAFLKIRNRCADQQELAHLCSHYETEIPCFRTEIAKNIVTEVSFKRFIALCDQHDFVMYFETQKIVVKTQSGKTIYPAIIIIDESASIHETCYEPSSGQTPNLVPKYHKYIFVDETNKIINEYESQNANSEELEEGSDILEQEENLLEPRDRYELLKASEDAADIIQHMISKGLFGITDNTKKRIKNIQLEENFQQSASTDFKRSS